MIFRNWEKTYWPFRAILISGCILACGSVSAQNHEEANYDESKIPPYTLPAVLTASDGTVIGSPEEWENIRRPELLDLFTEEIYGGLPDVSMDVSYDILEQDNEALGGKAVRKQVEMTFSNGAVTRKALMLIYLPASAGKAPVFLHFNFQGNQTVSEDPDIIPSQYSRRPRGNQTNRWPVEKIIDAGYGLATVHYFDFYLDRKDNFTESIMPLFGYGSADEVPDNGGMAISAWAWGYSRAMDYLETDKDVDASRVIIAGHSRLGKAALWAGAQDTRFAAVISNDSGCGGAALSMRRIGETVNEITKVFPHWFCRNFLQYRWNEDSLPVDQHELLALVAPRPLYVASAEEDRWADPRGEFLSAWHASEVYRLYGYEGIPSADMPEVNSPVMQRVGYHIRTGIHDVTDYDWDCFIAFADKWLKPRFGVTTLSANYLREEPDFTAELGNQALMGTVVEIIDEKDYWRQVKTPDPYTAWCVDLGIKEMSDKEVADYIGADKIICTADYSTVWTKPVGPARGRSYVRKTAGDTMKNSGKPDRGLQKICDIVAGDLLPYSGKTVKGCHEVRLLSGETGYVPAEDAEIFSSWAQKCDPSAENIISTAMRFIGVPYFWGGTSIKGVDCSGLTRMAWFLNGILLPRNASDQADIGRPISVDADTGRFPADSSERFIGCDAFRQEMLHRISNLQPGDLIFFGSSAGNISHVGIYIGDGRFIHASKLVRINSLIPGVPDFYELSGKMIKARRIIGSTASDGTVSISDSPAYFPQE